MLDSAPVAWLCPRVFEAGGEGEHLCKYLARSRLVADSCASIVQSDSVTCCCISQWLSWQHLEAHPCLLADVDGLITQALLTGNFESAVDLCLHDNRMADAIILAIAGGQELLSRTQEKYFAKMQSKITRVCVSRSELTCSYAFGNSLFHLKSFLAIL